MESEWARVAVAGSGFLADGFDLYIIGQVEKVLQIVYVCNASNVDSCIPHDEFLFFKSRLSAAALWGAVIGQIVFGTLADMLGRRIIFIVTGCLIVLGSLLSACVQGEPNTLLWQLVICRVLLGIGIGGEYPLSATICAEGTHPRRRGTLMALVFSNQGLGYLLSALLMVTLAYSECSYEFMWRFALAFGAVVPLVSLYFRIQMHESEDFAKMAIARDSGDASVDLLLTVRRYAWHLLGTAGNWFLFDIVWYANSLFNADVTSIIDVGPGGLKSDMLRTLIIVLIMLPGYFVGVAFINKMGRKNIQLHGYLHMILWFSVASFGYSYFKENTPGLFIIIYGLTFFFANFGPNLTTYVIPGEIFPTQAKATLHGASAALGKVGAALGSTAMPYVTNSPPTDDGIQRALLLCAWVAAVGLIFTVFFTPRYGPTDLVPSEPGESVGFVPLRFQRKTRQSYWAKKGGDISEEEEEEEEDEEHGEDEEGEASVKSGLMSNSH